MAAATPKVPTHYFVVNQLNQSADRRGPFGSAEDAAAWAQKHYPYAAWVIPATPVGKALSHRVLDKDGNPVQEG